MKSGFKLYLFAWAASLILFNTVAFVTISAVGGSEFTASFWIGYSLITACMLGNPVCAYFAFKAPTAKRTFYKLSLVRSNFIGIAVSFVFGILCMLVPDFPYWVSVIICAVVLFVNIISTVQSSGTIFEIERIDEKTKGSTCFIRNLTLDADNLLHLAKSKEISELCRPVYEAIRYSDPMSNDALSEIEGIISDAFSELTNAVHENKLDKVELSAKKLVTYIENRNKRCKALK